MEGLPANTNVVGILVLLAGLAAAAWWTRRMSGTIAGCLGRPRGGVVTGAVLVTTVCLGVTPYLAWRIVEDVRYTRGLDSWLVPRYGVSVFEVHPGIFDRALARLPDRATYNLRVDPAVERTSREAFEQWALTTLLPRIAVPQPHDADYLLTLGVPPGSLGVPVVQAERLWPPSGGMPAAYLARVDRPRAKARLAPAAGSARTSTGAGSQ